MIHYLMLLDPYDYDGYAIAAHLDGETITQVIKVNPTDPNRTQWRGPVLISSATLFRAATREDFERFDIVVPEDFTEGQLTEGPHYHDPNTGGLVLGPMP